MAYSVESLFMSKAESFFDASLTLTGLRPASLKHYINMYCFASSFRGIMTLTFQLALRLLFPILVIKYAQKVDDRVRATELTIKLKPKIVER